MRARVLALVIAGLLVAPAAAAAPVLLAQAGSTGGTIGKTGKSVSGETKSAPRSAEVPDKEVPEKTTPRKSHKKPHRVRKHTAPRVIESTEVESPRHRYRWCAVLRDGSQNCGFETIGQCRATISGIGGSCIPNN